MRGSPKGKAKKEQYLPAVDLDHYNIIEYKNLYITIYISLISNIYFNYKLLLLLLKKMKNKENYIYIYIYIYDFLLLKK